MPLLQVMTQPEMRRTNRRIMMRGLSGEALESYVLFIAEVCGRGVWGEVGG